MVQLAAQVSRHAGTLDRLGKGIEQVRSQASYFQKSSGSNEIHENVVAALAELYKDTISALSPRIVVNGEQGYLTIDSVVDKIRAALLAGIRGAVLWHQVGGRRWQLLFQRRRYVAEARWIMEKFEKERTLH
jgi:high frequency lysogenization protein